ncbi:DUF1816 domain-containing protein [cyanobacterium endosymbiont of Rhopalodia gibberula]|uniref:DUF1816 domain-containing protein n=1 Tax=cyanobacterium endosymbiont of Rhopalodia gibberula TaxID=1763363 RepID=UPI001E5AF9B7|nr:DUF1816 domain-containing protein [cyanobacterium endosymbiont of Rhopalodia gibberula]
MLKMLNFLGLAYWIEIITKTPQCTYYFGPFVRKESAQASYGGYLEDLQSEGAQEIQVIVKRCRPSNLTIFNEKENTQQLK